MVKRFDRIKRELEERIMAIETRQEKLDKRYEELKPILDKYKDEEFDKDGS